MFPRVHSSPSSFPAAAAAAAADNKDYYDSSCPPQETRQPPQHVTAGSSSLPSVKDESNNNVEKKSCTLLLTRPTKSCLSNSRLQDLATTAPVASASGGTCTSSSAPTLMLQRKVSFGHINIREHPRALGDHPSVSSGPALSLGWYTADPTQCQHSRTTEWPSLEAYERTRVRVRRSRHALRVPRHERQKILLEQAGVSYHELYAFAQETAQLKRSRSASLRDDNDNNHVPPVVRMLQHVGKRLFLFHQQESQQHSVEQKQLDDLMARAAAADRIRKQHDAAYWSQQEKGTATLAHSASEPFFLSLVSSGSDSDDSEQPLEF